MTKQRGFFDIIFIEKKDPQENPAKTKTGFSRLGSSRPTTVISAAVL